jgi:sulfur transfer complex TusBCD TusB component (DsrH family)
MGNYLYIESRDPFESRDTDFVAETASALKERGNEVAVFLVQNGVLAARKNARHKYISQLANAGVTVLADDFSLSERGIEPAAVHSAVKQSNVESLVDMILADDTKAIWH